MKTKYNRKPGLKKVACTVSAAALMLGASSATTVGLHFMEYYCGNNSYSGFPVTLTAFGIAPSGWENLTPMNTGYGSVGNGYQSSDCTALGYTLNEVISTTTSTNGLNPLPQGSLNVTWFGPTANFSGFAGYGKTTYGYDGDPPVPIPTGEWQVYSTFLRDGLNFGPGSSGPSNNQPGYNVDITGLKTLFPNNPFVIELIASSDSMQTLTNAFVVDATASTTNSVTYPNTAFPFSNEGGAPWYRGHGGGLSTFSAALNTDHVKIMSNHPQHGGTGSPPTGYDNAGTISGFIVTDKPLVSMPPQSVYGGPGDNVTLSAYAIGVPPLSYQWEHNGTPIPGATNLSYNISSLNAINSGQYALAVTNLYGSTVSVPATVDGGLVTLVPGTNFVADTNPTNTPRVGVNEGAVWAASNSDGTTTRTGVMQFVSTNSDEILVQGTTNFDVPQGTVTFWMRSPGSADPNNGASIFDRPEGSAGNEFLIMLYQDGTILFYAPGIVDSFFSQGTVNDDKWHFIALTFDNSANGGTTLYIDGVLDTTNNNGGTSWTWPVGKPFEIGKSSDPLGYEAYDGYLDDIRFYSRELNASEVTSVYSTGALIDPANLQMRLNFDTPPGAGYGLTFYPPGVILQSAPNAAGPYLDVPGAVNPFNLVPTVGDKFFRFRNYSHTPQTVISNPYLM
jgi:hypothetical protein